MGSAVAFWAGGTAGVSSAVSARALLRLWRFSESESSPASTSIPRTAGLVMLGNYSALQTRYIQSQMSKRSTVSE